MVEVRITSNIREVQRSLTLAQRDRLPSVMRNGLNDTAMDARNAERLATAGAFDRPRPLTKNAVVFPAAWKATKEHLVAKIGALRDEAAGGTPPAEYLRPQIVGGPRADKGHEIALRRVGLLDVGEHVVPARGAPLDANGNIRGSLIVAILSQLKAAESYAGYLMNETARSRRRAGAKRTKRYFVPPRGHPLPRGVYEREGTRIKAVLIFVRDAPTYKVRYRFGEAAERAVQTKFEGHYLKYFQREFIRKT